MLKPDGLVVAAHVAEADRALETADAWRVATGKEGGAAGGALGGVGVELGEADAIARQGVDRGCAEVGGVVTGEVGVAEVVGEDEEDVGAFVGRGSECERRASVTEATIMRARTDMRRIATNGRKDRRAREGATALISARV